MEKYLAFKKEHFDHFLVNRNIAIIQKSLQSIRKSEIKPMTRHNRVLSSHKINILKTPSISLIKNKSESMISSMKQIGSQKDLSLGKNYIIRTKNLSNMENSKLPKNKINMIRSSIDRNIVFYYYLLYYIYIYIS